MKIISKVVERKNEAQVNENIVATRVLVITDEGVSLGEQDTATAIKMAEARDLDLVCVAPNAPVPVCKFMDYSKYRYDVQKRAKEAKKNQKIVSVKEIRLTPVISIGDFETKLKAGIKFLQDGDKLKVTLTFNRRARMLNNNPDFSMLTKYIDATSEWANVERQPVLEGKNVSATLAPKKNNKK